MLLLPLVVIGAAFTGGIPEFNGWLAEHGVAGGKVTLAPELGPRNGGVDGRAVCRRRLHKYFTTTIEHHTRLNVLLHVATSR
jgi:hypothetical protein